MQRELLAEPDLWSFVFASEPAHASDDRSSSRLLRSAEVHPNAQAAFVIKLTKIVGLYIKFMLALERIIPHKQEPNIFIFFLEKDKCGFESESCGKQINQEYFSKEDLLKTSPTL